MEFNRATILAKALLRDRALEARERKDRAVREFHLSDNEAYPGSKKFSQALDVIIQYMADLADAKVSSVKDAHERTDIPITGQTVEEAISALRTSFDTLISARIGAWQGTLGLLNTRTGGMHNGSTAALQEAKRELTRQAARLTEKADSKLDILLQSSLIASEQKVKIAEQKSTSSLANTSQGVPPWFAKAGLVSAGIAFLFLTALVGMAIFGKEVPTSARMLVDIATAIATACAFTFIGGTAQAEGKIPFFQGQEPIKFATTGGVAVFVIVLGLLAWFYR
jgi:hypothetical protein